MHHPCIPHLSRLRSAFPRSPACRSWPAGQLLSTACTSSASRLLPGGTSSSICRRFESAREPSKKRSTERSGAGEASLRGRLPGGLSPSSRSRFSRCCSAGSGTKVTTRRYCCGGASHCPLPPTASQCPSSPAAAAAAGFWPANVDVDKGAGCAGVGTASAAAAANSVAAAGCTGCTGCAATAARNSAAVAAAAAAAGSLGAAVGAAGSTQRITASTAVGSSSCAATQGRPRCRAAANTDGCCAHCHAVLSRQQAAAICGRKSRAGLRQGARKRNQSECAAEAHLQGRLEADIRHPSSSSNSRRQ